jgi:RluA family pseudouridine synthase
MAMPHKPYGTIYEDEWLMVIDKPSGMLVIPTPKKETDTLTDILNRDLNARGAGPNAYPCHRLDRETSGLIVYAKGKAVQRLMMDEFKKRLVKKRYIAFVDGTIKHASGVISKVIFNRNKKRNETAVTRYRVIRRMRCHTMLEAEPVTGRTNQIRIHMAGIGHPILGERVYAFRRDFNVKFKRLALHAALIEFTHPVTGRKMSFASPLPENLKTLTKD